MKDAQTSFQILRLSAASRLLHLLRTVPPSITRQAAADYDALVEWGALASIIACDGAAAAGLPTPEKEAHDSTVCQKRPTWDTRPYGRPTCPSEKAALDLPAPAPSNTRPTSVATPSSWNVSPPPPPGGNLSPLLGQLPEQPMASALLGELKTVATEVKKSQMEDAVGNTRVALPVEEGL